jgi:hypothetical protein
VNATTLSLAAGQLREPPLPDDLASAPISHLRLGSSTCAQRLPGTDALREALEHAAAHGWGAELSTPTLTDDELPRALAGIETLAAGPVVASVVINDLGLLRRLSGRRDVGLVAGRLLHRQQRDPRLAGVRPEQLGSASWPVSWGLGSAASPSWLRWLLSTGIERLEMDLPPVGDLPDLRALPTPVSLHLPWSLVATGRRCRDVELEPDRCSAPCRLGGREASLALPGPAGGEARLLQCGKAEWSRIQPARMEAARDWLAGERGPDRVIWQPEPRP